MAKGWRKKGGKLSSHERNALPSSDFALSGRRYPIENASHGRNALARVAQHGDSAEKAAVRKKVASKFPAIGNAKADKRYGARSH